MKIAVKSLNDVENSAIRVLEFLKDNHIKFLIVKGDMGAGKTTFIVEMLKQLKVDKAGSSPTFSILNEYFSVNYGIVYHFDFYRIKSEMEALDIGVEEIFDADSYVFIEWPERIENLLPSKFVSMTIKVVDQERNIELEVV
jgi:tRNA threonylcarbamoyladenosine biosynthesis protein TsaE